MFSIWFLSLRAQPYVHNTWRDTFKYHPHAALQEINIKTLRCVETTNHDLVFTEFSAGHYGEATPQQKMRKIDIYAQKKKSKKQSVLILIPFPTNTTMCTHRMKWHL